MIVPPPKEIQNKQTNKRNFSQHFTPLFVIFIINICNCLFMYLLYLFQTPLEETCIQTTSREQCLAVF